MFAMHELFPASHPVFASALLAVGGWLIGGVLWVLVGKLKEVTRKTGGRSPSAGRRPVVLIARRESQSSREVRNDMVPLQLPVSSETRPR